MQFFLSKTTRVEQNPQIKIASPSALWDIATYTHVVKDRKVAPNDNWSIVMDISNNRNEVVTLPASITQRRKKSTVIDPHMANELKIMNALNAALCRRPGEPLSPLNPPGTWNAAAKVIVARSPATTDRVLAMSFI